MRVLDGLEALRESGPTLAASRTAVCVGVFDGVHLGHLRLLHELVEMAAQLGAVPTVITFRAHPDALLRGETPPLLISIPHRLRLLRRAGVQLVLLLDFDARVRDLTAEQFARDILAGGLHTAGLLLGYDSAIGKDRGGTPQRLRELGAQFDYSVRVATPFTLDGEPVSSTRIRDAIHRGQLSLAHRLLGRWPSAFGHVVHGDGRGRTLGFATANVAVQTAVLPPNGVYAVQALHDGDLYPGVANLGTRPTFGGERGEAVLEVHLLDFTDDLYGATLEVSFCAKLRDEQRFAGADALRAQIARDVAAARAALAS